jgi:hypothetical protein
VVVGRVAVGDVAADGAAVAHLRVGDQPGRLAQQRHPPLQDRRRDEVVLHRHRPDADGVAVLADATQFVDAVEVDQVRRLGEAQLHHRQQAVAAGQQLGITAERAQQVQRLAHGAWCVVLEGGWDHRRLRLLFGERPLLEDSSPPSCCVAQSRLPAPMHETTSCAHESPPARTKRSTRQTGRRTPKGKS